MVELFTTKYSTGNFMNPIILINFKTYRNGTGKRALELATIAEDVALETGVNIYIAVEIPSIYMISKIVTIPVLAQHIDYVDFGPYTGHILAESVKEHGAYGTLLNHSERKVEKSSLAAYLKKCRDIDLKSVVCISNIDEINMVAKLNPDYIAFEDPTLIGSGKSISKTKPNLLKQFIKELTIANRHVVPLCGAGISNKQDIELALRLGLEGVLVSSSFVNSNRPRDVLMEMAAAMNKDRY